MNDLADTDLIARCLTADAPRAFEVLHERHGPCVRAFLHGFTGGDEHTVADCAQATWLRAFRALPRFDRERALRPWLLTIAARVAIDAEARRRRVEVVDGDALAGVSIVWPDARTDVRDAVEQLLREAATRVSPRKLEAFLLSRAHGLSHHDVAARTGSSLATVKRDLAEATTILAGLAEELGLMPERLAAAVVREPATVGWTPPADGLLTARHLEQVMALFRHAESMGAELRARPIEDVAQAQDLLARFTERTTECFGERSDGAEQQDLSWAMGVVKRTARALLCADPAAMARLEQDTADELREVEARHAETRAQREQARRAVAPEATDQEREEGARARAESARALELRHRSAVMALGALEQMIEQKVAAGRVDERTRSELDKRTGAYRAQVAAAQECLEALRRGDAAAWFDLLEQREARDRQWHLEGARSLADLRRSGGDGALLGIPARNVALVRPRLDEVLRLLGRHMVMAGEERRA